MGKIIKHISVLVVITFILTSCGVKTWKYDLPNNYQIRKTSSLKIKVGYVKNNKLYTKLDDKEIGITKYVGEFQTSDNFVGLRCIENDNLNVIYYLIDTINQNVYGPYSDYETYEKVKEKISGAEKFSEFKPTTDFEK